MRTLLSKFVTWLEAAPQPRVLPQVEAQAQLAQAVALRNLVPLLLRVLRVRQQRVRLVRRQRAVLQAQEILLKMQTLQRNHRWLYHHRPLPPQERSALLG